VFDISDEDVKLEVKTKDLCAGSSSGGVRYGGGVAMAATAIVGV
jgi:hypothetical protein